MLKLNVNKVDEIRENLDKICTLLEQKIHYRSPLRYPGGKSKACNVLYGIYKEHFHCRHTVLLSPFFGGGSFEFHMLNNVPALTLHANDIFKQLMDFRSTVKYNNCQPVDSL